MTLQRQCISTLASSKSPRYHKAITWAMVMLFLPQAVVSIYGRVKPLKDLIDNEPVVLMAHGEYYWNNIKQASLSKSDIH